MEGRVANVSKLSQNSQHFQKSQMEDSQNSQIFQEIQLEDSPENLGKMSGFFFILMGVKVLQKKT
jgi:hypothetical protein